MLAVHTHAPASSAGEQTKPWAPPEGCCQMSQLSTLTLSCHQPADGQELLFMLTVHTHAPASSAGQQTRPRAPPEGCCQISQLSTLTLSCHLQAGTQGFGRHQDAAVRSVKSQPDAVLSCAGWHTGPRDAQWHLEEGGIHPLLIMLLATGTFAPSGVDCQALARSAFTHVQSHLIPSDK